MLDDSTNFEGPYLEIWKLHRRIQEAVPILRDVQIKLHSLSIDVLLRQDRATSWGEIFFMLTGPAVTLAQGDIFLHAQAMGKHPNVLSNPNAERIKGGLGDVTAQIQALEVLLRTVVKKMKSGRATPELLGAVGDSLKTTAIQCWAHGSPSARLASKRDSAEIDRYKRENSS
jgi:hypothetical protein